MIPEAIHKLETCPVNHTPSRAARHEVMKQQVLRPRAYLMCHGFICTYILPYTSRVRLCVPPDRLTAHTGHPRYLDT